MSRTKPILFVLVLSACVLASGCSRSKPTNANKDIQKHQMNLMDAMDKIAADEEKKRQAEEAKKDGESKTAPPADSAPGATAPAGQEPKPAAPERAPESPKPPDNSKPC